MLNNERKGQGWMVKRGTGQHGIIQGVKPCYRGNRMEPQRKQEHGYFGGT